MSARVIGGTVCDSVRASPFETVQRHGQSDMTDEERREVPAPSGVANECASDERVRKERTPPGELNHVTCQRSRRRFTIFAPARPIGGCVDHQSVHTIRPRLVRRIGLVTALGVNCLLAVMGLSILTGAGRTNGAVLLIDGAVAGGLSAWGRTRSSRSGYGGRSEGHVHQTVMSRLGDLDASVDADSLLVEAARVLGETRCLPYVRLDMYDADGAPARDAQYGSPGFGATCVVINTGSQLACRLEIATGPGRRGAKAGIDDVVYDELNREVGAIDRSLRLGRQFQATVVMTREEERRRLRHDLHDGVGPSLAAQVLLLEGAADLCHQDSHAIGLILGRLSVAARETLADLRDIVDDLRSAALEVHGLVDAIRAQAQQFVGVNGTGRGIWTDVDAAGELGVLPIDVESAALHIAVEAITNAARHSGGDRCRATLRRSTDLEITIIDNGCGIPSAPIGGVGLESMRARASALGGACVIARRRDQPGTSVTVNLPLRD